jgi:hypothetical protein
LVLRKQLIAEYKEGSYGESLPSTRPGGRGKRRPFGSRVGKKPEPVAQ